jgi:predicted outer membrane repeat protein
LVLAGTVASVEAVVVGTGTPASCNETAFNAAIAAINPGGGTITFNCGGAATINFTSQKILYNPQSPGNVYTIDGGNLITLNGQGVTRHIFHLSGSLNVFNITLTGGRASGADDNGSGGAIRSDRNPSQVPAPVGLLLNNVTFTNNVTNVTSTTPPFQPFDYGGGAVFSRLEFMTVQNCRFIGNSALNSSGGAIHGRSSTISITGSTFTSNVSTGGGFGGAMHIDGASPNGSGGQVQIGTSTFSGHTALQQGGAIFAFFHPGLGEQFLMDTVSVTNNHVTDSGNVPYVGRPGNGGGVCTNFGTITVRNTTVSGNSVRGQVSTNGPGIGGGLMISNADAVSITNSTISGNRAFGGNNEALGGGLLILGNGQPFQIVHSTITQNQSDAFGGAIHSQANGILANTIVSSNTAPGGQQCFAQLTNGGGAMQFPDSNPRCANAIAVANPLLGALANNGGFTQTHLPQGGSPLVNAVGCPISIDQRGVARPQGPACDVGSVEVTCSISVSAPLTLPTGRVGTAYSQVFAIAGGANPGVSLAGALPSGMSFSSSTRTLSGTPSQSGNFPITVSASEGSCNNSRAYNLTIASTVAINPSSLTVDQFGNSVLEANQGGVIVDPGWTNLTGGGVNLTGTLSSFIGPPGATYTINDGSAAYGVVTPGATARCSAAGNCYIISIAAASRPEVHWDASAVESLSSGGPKAWALHVGGSFGDVTASNIFYRDVEIMLHRGITGGCGGNLYCPANATTREQMAVFALLAKEGPGYSPPACSAPNTFNDVPASSPFCRYIEELARRGVVSGCGGGNYCPTQAVARDQMAVFVLLTLDPNMNPPACNTPVFNDVPANNPFCRWIEELFRRGVVGGCGGGNYCPGNPVTRDQMGVFLSGTFGLTLYGP